MSTLNWFKMASEVAVAFVGVELGGTGAVAAGIDVICQYGVWQAKSDTDSSDEMICGVRTFMCNGAELRLILVGVEAHMVAHDPPWPMRTDARPRVAFNVDGEVCRRTAVAANTNTLVIQSLTSDFLGDFALGSSMKADLTGHRRAVSLAGSGRTSAMAGCAAAAGRGLAS